ncbi:uncharacterized protein LOC144369871 [Ictidomys tridecemlineatus]
MRSGRGGAEGSNPAALLPAQVRSAPAVVDARPPAAELREAPTPSSGPQRCGVALKLGSPHPACGASPVREQEPAPWSTAPVWTPATSILRPVPKEQMKTLPEVLSSRRRELALRCPLRPGAEPGEGDAGVQVCLR